MSILRGASPGGLLRSAPEVQRYEYALDSVITLQRLVVEGDTIQLVSAPESLVVTIRFEKRTGPRVLLGGDGTDGAKPRRRYRHEHGFGAIFITTSAAFAAQTMIIEVSKGVESTFEPAPFEFVRFASDLQTDNIANGANDPGASIDTWGALTAGGLAVQPHIMDLFHVMDRAGRVEVEASEDNSTWNIIYTSGALGAGAVINRENLRTALRYVRSRAYNTDVTPTTSRLTRLTVRNR